MRLASQCARIPTFPQNRRLGSPSPCYCIISTLIMFRIISRQPLLKDCGFYFKKDEVYRLSNRLIFSKTGIWPRETSLELRKEVDSHWKDKLNHREINNGEKFYIVPMFPYPSGKLHLGHVRVYTISDIVARIKRFQGNRVLLPMGWDAFGLPAENAAKENNQDPETWTKSNIAAMKAQLLQLGLSIDWDQEISTCSPDYYKWTQFLFLKLLEKGLAYKSEAVVNWDPIDRTVLATEQVDQNGRAWRSGAKVEKKKLNQWFLRTSSYNKVLYNSLNDLIKEEIIHWDSEIVKTQKQWIGESKGFTIELDLIQDDKPLTNKLQVWTDKLELIYGTSFLAISNDHILNQDQNFVDSSKLRLKCQAVHPLTGELIPIFLNQDLHFTFPISTNLKIGIPCSDEQDFEFADKHGLKKTNVVDTEGTFECLINSDKFTGLQIPEARKRIIEHLKEKEYNIYETSGKLRDWLISRQRFWGTPIPVVHCPNCKMVPVPYEELPVVLPKWDQLTGPKTLSPLGSAIDWVKTKCPKCGSKAQRETDTMDTFVDSSWYYLRYLDPKNADQVLHPDKKSFMPVDLYIGGLEHADVHLYYARFISHFCHTIGLIDNPEPFSEVFAPGMVLGNSFKSAVNEKYLKPEEIDQSGKKPIEKSTGKPVVQKWEKMSKSKHNGIDPQAIIDEYGIDTLRLFICGSASSSSPLKWSGERFDLLLRWQRNLWFTVTEFRYLKEGFFTSKPVTEEIAKEKEAMLTQKRNTYLSQINNGFVRQYNPCMAINLLLPWTSSIRSLPKVLWNSSEEFQRSFAAILTVLSPIMPHFGSELWEGFRTVAENHISHYDISKGLLEQKWPEVDSDYPLKLKIIIGERQVHEFKMPKNELDILSKDKALELALNLEEVETETPNGILWTKYVRAPGANVEFYIYPNSI